MDCYKHPESCRTQGHHDHNDDGNHHAVNGNHIADPAYQSCFVLGDSNVNRGSSRRGIRVPIHHDPVSKTIQRNWIIGTRTIHPSMSLVVDGDGSEIPGLTKKSPNKLRGGKQVKVRDQDEQ